MKGKLILTAALIGVAGMACAGTIATPYVAGEFNGWDAGANAMVETGAGSGIWTHTISGLTANQRQEFKVTDGTWDSALPSANSWYVADGLGSVTITYDGNTYADGWLPATDRMGADYDPGAWTIVGGGFWGGVGGSDWNNADAAGAMTSIGSGIYSLMINDVAEGTHEWKAVVTGTWDAIGSDSRSINAGNLNFTATETENDVIFSVNALTGAATVEVIPEPATLSLIGMAGVVLLVCRRKFSM